MKNDLAREVILRHRAPGYLRFDLPVVRTTLDPAALKEGLLSVDGVYRVDFQAGAKKLSVRFHSEFCSFEHLIRQLHALIRKIGTRTRTALPKVIASAERGIQLGNIRLDTLIGWIRHRLEVVRETFEALKILLSRSVANRPRWAKEFMNDLLMLFLIKLHWQHIITEWLPRPWTYRYEWAATLYLIYLSVQARIPQPA